MPLCPRCALVAVVLAFLAFSGCDTTNPSRELAVIEGTYSVAELTFRPDATAIDPVDVGAQLNAAETRLRIFGGDDVALFVVQPVSGVSRRVDLRTTASRGRVTFEALTRQDEEDLATLLLPRSFTLDYTGERPMELAGSFSRTNVNLETFDAERYRGLRNTSGQLRLRFERR